MVTISFSIGNVFKESGRPVTEPRQRLTTPDFWVGLDPDLNCHDETLMGLYRYWQEKCGTRRMPSRRDIDPLELQPHLGNVVLIDVEHDPLRLRYRLVGTKITDVMERDSTGSIYESFEWMIDNRTPLRTHGEAFYPDKNFYVYETLNLPLSDDDETINMVLGGLVFHLKSSIEAPP
jgi:hypothetical protein